MVDVGAKVPTRRTAYAVATVVLPPALAELVKDGEIASPKGAVFQTASLAGILGAKRTSDWIPLCHPLPLEDCKVQLEAGEPLADGSAEVLIHCRVATTAKTGVEMEALTGAAAAALTLYDMGKSVARQIVIREIRLVEKTGGSSA